MMTSRILPLAVALLTTSCCAILCIVLLYIDYPTLTEPFHFVNSTNTACTTSAGYQTLGAVEPGKTSTNWQLSTYTNLINGGPGPAVPTVIRYIRTPVPEETTYTLPPVRTGVFVKKWLLGCAIAAFAASLLFGAYLLFASRRTYQQQQATTILTAQTSSATEDEAKFEGKQSDEALPAKKTTEDDIASSCATTLNNPEQDPSPPGIPPRQHKLQRLLMASHVALLFMLALSIAVPCILLLYSCATFHLLQGIEEHPIDFLNEYDQWDYLYPESRRWRQSDGTVYVGRTSRFQYYGPAENAWCGYGAYEPIKPYSFRRNAVPALAALISAMFLLALTLTQAIFAGLYHWRTIRRDSKGTT